MKITALFLMASLLAFPAFAQRGGRGGARGAGGHSERNTGRGEVRVEHSEGNHGFHPGDRIGGSSYRGHIDRLRGVRFIGGHQEVFFGGLWFDCAFWPVWIYDDDVYVVATGGDVYTMFNYTNPSLSLSITVVP